jgi:hypothetical protein
VATIGVVIVLASMGNDWPSFGFSSFVHFQSPKSLCISFAFPLLMVHGLAFARRPTRRNWILLLATQIAALGMTSSALMTAPVLVLITLIVGARCERVSIRTALIGLTSCLYGAALALFWMNDMRRAVDAMDAPAGYVMDVPTNIAAMEMMLKVSLGSGLVAVVTLASLLLAWTLPPGRQARRFLLLAPLLWFFVFVNPIWARALSADLVDPVLFRRFFWIVPVPAAMAVAFLLPTHLPRLRPRAGVLLSAGLLLLYALTIPKKTTLEEPTSLEFSWTKTRPANYGAARLLVEHAPEGTFVLAPFQVATWVSTFHHHPPLFFSRKFYQRFLAAELGAEEAKERAAIVRDFTQRPPVARDERRLREVLKDYDIGAFCHVGTDDPEVTDPKHTVRKVMRKCGFVYVGRSSKYHCWIRAESESAGERP